jgi:hypothetical protein
LYHHKICVKYFFSICNITNPFNLKVYPALYVHVRNVWNSHNLYYVIKFLLITPVQTFTKI